MGPFSRTSTCLFVLCILALAVGCAAKPRLASPEDVLKEIAASRWKIDVEASLRVDSAAREEIENIGRDKFIENYGQLGFSINAQKREIAWYGTGEGVSNAAPLSVAPESAADVAERKNGARQVRLIMDGDAPILLRYADAGKLLFFMEDGKDELIGVFAPLEK